MTAALLYSRTTESRADAFQQRAFEILPGALSWSLLIGMVLLSFLNPMLAAVIVIAFDLYWLLRLLHGTLFLVLGYLRLSMDASTNWMERLADLDALAERRPSPRRRPAHLLAAFSERLHRGALKRTLRDKRSLPGQADIRHLVIVPVCKEDAAIVEPGLRALAEQTFPAQRIAVVLALEARAPQAIRESLRALRLRYRERFTDILLTEHPDGLPGEARVKGANATWAARAAREWFEARGYPLESIVVSCFDADTVVDPRYMACLTYHFILSEDRERASFQPIPVYNNNIWDVPGFARVLDIGSSFFQLMESTNPETLVTFSSHSMSFGALTDIDYWPTDMISDDSAIYWKALMHFQGRYRTVPMPITLSMDVADAKTWWKTAGTVYRQKRRWAWGVENVPIVLRGFIRGRRIPLHLRIKHTVKLLESHLAWATWPFMLAVIGWLPAILATRSFSDSVLYYSAPRILQTIFRLASISLITSIALSLLLLPPRPKRLRHTVGAAFLHAIEWLFVPLTTVFLSAIPALDAQTRLMLGHRMTFFVTDKTRRQTDRQ